MNLSVFTKYLADTSFIVSPTCASIGNNLNIRGMHYNGLILKKHPTTNGFMPMFDFATFYVRLFFKRIFVIWYFL